MENIGAPRSQRVLRMLRCGSVTALLPRITEGTLMCAIGLLLWYTAYSFHNAGQAHDSRQPPAPAKAVNFDLTPLTNLHLFGIQPVSIAVQTRLQPADIHLIGVLASVNPHISSAIVSENGDTHTWHIGDTLPDGSVLDAIESNSITLRRGTTATLIPFEIRPAPLDVHFDTLALGTVTETNSSESPVSAAAAGYSQTQIPARSQYDRETQLKTLRTQALQVMVRRMQYTPHKIPPHPG